MNSFYITEGTVWCNPAPNTLTKTLYSDRMYQQDPDRFNVCCKEVWGVSGQYFYRRSPQDIERFISLYLGKEVILCSIRVDENVSSGYPYWTFEYCEKQLREADNVKFSTRWRNGKIVSFELIG